MTSPNKWTAHHYYCWGLFHSSICVHNFKWGWIIKLFSRLFCVATDKNLWALEKCLYNENNIICNGSLMEITVGRPSTSPKSRLSTRSLGNERDRSCFRTAVFTWSISRSVIARTCTRLFIKLIVYTTKSISLVLGLKQLFTYADRYVKTLETYILCLAFDFYAFSSNIDSWRVFVCVRVFLLCFKVKLDMN